ncbi:hypothetical protein BIV25_28415 [Streptomyces sp. MUSC 14]|uniref:hypothetical protein n=1 Tax=Streptomyces sp. MUSC 14 TaxID=1354889 RepID=UPI0008F57A2E|nr:hypothetical protein [Streptomyces sp. MUSC 14]OIJ92224.1 hypothetical protein BIV25_28415 [Streptomyces sp. MUSC 14]
MARTKTTQERPIDLPVGANAWLLDCVPAPGCVICSANWRQLGTARDAGDITKAARHATEIRDHASGVHK